MTAQDKIERELEEGMRQLGLYESSDELAAYVGLLHKWNQVYNLTAVRDKHMMVSRHLLDSLAILPWVSGRRILDVGTGPGLPGVPLALIRPDLHIVLLDSQGKKIRFLQEVKRLLRIDNIEIIQDRVERYQPERGFDTIVSRAFSDLAQMVKWTEHLIARDGIWLAMKGRKPDTELSALQYPYRVEVYTVPNLDAERCCVIINKD